MKYTLDEKRKTTVSRFRNIQETAEVLGMNTDRLVSAMDAILAIFDQDDPIGKCYLPHVSLSLNMIGTWAMECSVELKFFALEVPTTHYPIAVRTLISWGSTQRDLAHATTAVAQYEKLIKFAAYCECVFTD